MSVIHVEHAQFMSLSIHGNEFFFSYHLRTLSFPVPRDRQTNKWTRCVNAMLSSLDGKPCHTKEQVTYGHILRHDAQQLLNPSHLLTAIAIIIIDAVSVATVKYS